MVWLGEGGTREWVDDELLAQFERLADKPSGPVSGDAQIEMVALCGDDDTALRQLNAWLFLERNVRLEHVKPEVKGVIDIRTLRRFSIASSSLRRARANGMLIA